MEAMKVTPGKVRTTVDIPSALYRRLKEEAAARGCSARQLILQGIEKVVEASPQPARRRVKFPLIRSRGPKVEVTSEMIYAGVDFP
jgi:hypothetical protein